VRKVNQNPSPFKFLAAYEAKDADAFWGRNDEIEKLYELLLATNLVMVYGSSGIGKTSLIQCGLSKKFSGPDWIPRFIRRGNDFNHSLLTELQKISPEKGFNSVEENIQAIDNKYHRPVYLFFDQFEEIFTVNEKDQSKSLDELVTLFQNLERLRKNSTCKIIIIIREEFLGQLYDYEQYLSYLFDFRLRIEPMNKTKVEEVVTETFKKFDVSCKTEKLPVTIANKLMIGKANVQLSYLQVYLDKIWNEAFKTFKTNNPSFDEDFDELKIEISEDNLESVGSIEEVLENYVATTTISIANDKDIKLSVESVRGLLDLFVTDEGTKKPLTFNTLFSLVKNSMSEDILRLVLDKLDDFRLISIDNDYYELAHDSLAKIIDSKRTGTQLIIKNLKENILSNMKNKARLDDVIIKNYDDLEKQGIDLNLEEGIVKYVDESKKYRRNQKWLLGILLFFVFVGVILVSLLYRQAKNQEAQTNMTLIKANINLKKYNQEKAKELINDAKTYQKSGDLEDAKNKIIKADSLDPDNPEIDSLMNILYENPK
jgi:cell division protein FtsL